MTSQSIRSKRSFIGQLLSMNVYLTSPSSSHFFIPPLISFPLGVYPPIHPSLLCLSPPSPPPTLPSLSCQYKETDFPEVITNFDTTTERFRNNMCIFAVSIYFFTNPCCQSNVTTFQNLMRLFDGCSSPAVPAPLSLYRSSLSGDERTITHPLTYRSHHYLFVIQNIWQKQILTLLIYALVVYAVSYLHRDSSSLPHL